MPGHFIVGWGPLDRPLYIDVFNRGQIVTEAECLALSNLAEEHRLVFREQFLRPVTKKDILFRMLLNLKQIYIHREDWPAAYRTVDLMLLVRPDQVNELRDRGLLAYRLDQLQEAIFDLKRYLFLVPDNSDKAWLETRLELMEERLLQLN
jgi:regulator of sirC expression with transglutaminase-like and TPR domain